MANSQLPARLPERQPETNTSPRPAWPRPVKKPARFSIRIVGSIPL